MVSQITAVIASISPTHSHQTRPDATPSSRVLVQPRPLPTITFRLVSSGVASVHVRRSRYIYMYNVQRYYSIRSQDVYNL